MPSQTGLPAINQRPQIVSRFEVPVSQTNIDPTQVSKEQKETGVQGPQTQVVQRTQESSKIRFPFENQVERFRGDIQGRSVRQSLNSTALSRLPRQVMPFNPLNEQGLRVGSLNPAESAALGLTPVGNSKSNESVDFPPIAGSGEILARIEENTQSQSSETNPNLNVGRGIEVEEEKSALEVSNLSGSEEGSETQLRADQSTQPGQTQESKEKEDKDAFADQDEKKPNGDPLTDTEKREVEDLEKRDQEVRQHEQAHVSAGGRHIRGGIQYDYTQGPNGKRYVVGGEVDIDLSPESTPQATITKMQQVRQAALAPAEPSAADRSVAAAASQREQQARAELSAEQRQANQERAEEMQSKEKTQDQTETQATQEAKSTQGVDSSESLAGAQVIPPTGGTTQRQLEGFDSYPLSSFDSYPLFRK